jgi:hypothetical protein
VNPFDAPVPHHDPVFDVDGALEDLVVVREDVIAIVWMDGVDERSRRVIAALRRTFPNRVVRRADVKHGAISGGQIEHRRDRLGKLAEAALTLAHPGFAVAECSYRLGLTRRRIAGVDARRGLASCDAEASAQDGDGDGQRHDETGEDPRERKLIRGGHGKSDCRRGRLQSGQTPRVANRQAGRADTTAGGGERARRVADL